MKRTAGGLVVGSALGATGAALTAIAGTLCCAGPGAGYLVKAYPAVLGLAVDAWDIYMIYGPDARWDGATPPAPTYWMHQLRGASGPELDEAVFEQHLAQAVPGGT